MYDIKTVYFNDKNVFEMKTLKIPWKPSKIILVVENPHENK